MKLWTTSNVMCVTTQNRRTTQILTQLQTKL